MHKKRAAPVNGAALFNQQAKSKRYNAHQSASASGSANQD
jgi:hypothetical protein